ncbi:MAG: PKD domain-containing protein [Culturomica sp.]|jgi:gliding motility-associated-like protein/uncharacterized protein (TIGR02145 family)|nr:PKD domain-containing protein [Culturomica sp.]
MSRYTYIFLLAGLLIPAFLPAQEPEIGDVITLKNGDKGVVFWLFPDGTGGWATALTDMPGTYEWGPVGVEIPGLSEQKRDPFLHFRDTAGYGNTGALRAFLGPGSKYAAQVVDYENGWYLPSVEQLSYLTVAMLDIGPVLLQNGGKSFEDEELDGCEARWSSTAFYNQENLHAEAVSLGCKLGMVTIFSKDTSLIIRPVCTFRTDRLHKDSTLTYRWRMNGVPGAETARITDYPAATVEYVVSVANAEGCSTSDAHRILVASAAPEVIYDTICRGERYRANGFDTDAAGEHTIQIAGSGGCTTDLTLHLAVLQRDTTRFAGMICEGEVYGLHHFSEYEPGVHWQVWPGAGGCDSVVRLELEVIPVRGELEETICEGESYTKHGFNLSGVTAGGEHTLNIPRPGLCDSVVSLYLHVDPLKRRSYSTRICTGSAYAGYGFSLPGPLRADTVCTLRTSNVSGCDSLVTLSLRVDPLPETWRRDTVCAGTPFSDADFTLPALMRDTLCVDTLHTVHGCDSLVYLALTVMDCSPCSAVPVNGVYWAERNVAAPGHFAAAPESAGMFYQWNRRKGWPAAGAVAGWDNTDAPGSVWEAANDPCPAGWRAPTSDELYKLLDTTRVTSAWVTRNGVHGRRFTDRVSGDSIFLPAAGFRDFPDGLLVSPNNEGYFWSGSTGSSPLAYNLHFSGSVISLQGQPYRRRSFSVRCVTDLTAYDTTLYDTLCAGESYNRHGFLLAAVEADTVLKDTLVSYFGCDSVVRLALTVNSSIVVRDTVMLCLGDTLRRNGQVITGPGTFPATFPSASGCDSTEIVEVYRTFRFNGALEILPEKCETYTWLFAAAGNTNDIGQNPAYLWAFGDGNSSSGESPLHSYADSGFYTVALQVLPLNGCDTMLYGEVTVEYYPVALGVYSDRTTATFQNPEIRFWTDHFAGMTYEWDFGDGGRGTGAEVTHRYDVSKAQGYTVRLTVTNGAACVVERVLAVKLENGLHVPNTFSPNDDGVGDFFMPGFRVRILNRNGTVLYQGSNGWDGTYKGKPVPQDTYFYLLWPDENNSAETVKGYITVVR